MQLKGLKFLIVDDDAFFREILEKCLHEEGAEVLSVESIEHAKAGIPMYAPNYIVSDVQMPGGTGIDLLNWAKATKLSTPIIIMTGFSELVDATTAAQAGAAAFLAKPFRREDLFSVVQHLTPAGLPAEGSGAAPAVTNDLDFMKVSVEDLIVGSQIEYPIFLRLPSSVGSRYVKIAHRGEDLSVDRVRAYREKGVRHVYLARADYLKYLGLSVRVTQSVSGVKAISDEKRARLLRNTLEVVEQQIYCAEISEEVFEHAKTIVDVSVSVLSGTDGGYLVLESIKEISDEVYAHAAAVSMIASMIAKEIGWSSAKTLNKVAMAGMLHDVGKRQLSRELALKSKTQMTAAEIVLYETHPALGMNILSELDFVPSDVIQAVYHHHERSNGSGFPSHLTDVKIFPLAKVIAVADEFCKIYLRSEERQKGDPKKAVVKLMEFHSEGLAPESLVGLHRAFGIVPPEHLLKKTKKGANQNAA